MTASYDDSNVFAKILRGELPAHVGYGVAEPLAFMDVMPAVDGHVLVIPKAKARNILDIRPHDLAAVIETVRKIAVAAKTAFLADGVTIQQFSEAAGGQEVFHLHFHILPRQAADQVRKLPRPFADQQVLAAHAEKIRAALTA